MVNTEMVKRKLAKGLTTGVGVFASTFVGNVMENRLPFGGTGVGVGQMALGAGIAVGSERLGELAGQRAGQPAGLMEIGIEHVGYGIHGAGFAELADELQTGARAERMVNVKARRDSASNQTGAQASQQQREQNYSLDTA